MATPNTQARYEVKIPCQWNQSSARARVTIDGDLELEVYDFSDEAQQHMGNDVAWTWTVSAEHLPILLRQLPPNAAVSDEAVITALVATHSHVHAIRDWIRTQGIPFHEDFDSWA